MASVKPILSDSIAYIRRRLPQLGASEVHLDVEAHDDLEAEINPDLFAWVIENLVRNGWKPCRARAARSGTAFERVAGCWWMSATPAQDDPKILEHLPSRLLHQKARLGVGAVLATRRDLRQYTW
jgi:hypothetical protein